MLSDRQREALELAAQGLSIPQIAGRMSCSPGTVAGHLHIARGKLEALNTTHAVALALKRELIHPPLSDVRAFAAR